MNPKQADGEGSEALSKERLHLWQKLLKASGLIKEELRRRLRAECNSTLPRFDVMSALAERPEGMMMSEISTLLRVSNGNITGIIDKLAEDELVMRFAVPGDRRAQKIRLTGKGLSVFADIAAHHEAWINDILGRLNADDIEGIIRRIDYLTHALEDETEGVK
ncbi:MarR family winged helix-turn-helix transcriptional regulator [Rhizobium sp. L1K21]|uniref:MarR family winged helix-turn-helix transcriptional regulator n=1 Tax=Rhizobium sp. L1K21 TaxID=2954933 RepID=UPI0020931722|nr:MarR family transcriptional regulator [Rhizobium sp. L1K21]MCO6188571.1 MarR family transcriptional regulator [Rhizobium sp. L1K21]